MKRKFRVLAALVLALLLCVGAACAETTTRCDFDALEMNGEWTEGRMRPYEYHYYPFTVAQTGRVTARVQSFYSGAEFELLDEDLVSWRAVWVNGTAGAPETEDLVYYLEPGQYYLRVDGASDSDGDYRVKVALEPCACDEIEGNDDYHGAQQLPSGEALAGVLTEWDEYDVLHLHAGRGDAGASDGQRRIRRTVRADAVRRRHGGAGDDLRPARLCRGSDAERGNLLSRDLER